MDTQLQDMLGAADNESTSSLMELTSALQVDRRSLAIPGPETPEALADIKHLQRLLLTRIALKERQRSASKRLTVRLHAQCEEETDYSDEFLMSLLAPMSNEIDVCWQTLAGVSGISPPKSSGLASEDEGKQSQRHVRSGGLMQALCWCQALMLISLGSLDLSVLILRLAMSRSCSVFVVLITFNLCLLCGLKVEIMLT